MGPDDREDRIFGQPLPAPAPRTALAPSQLIAPLSLAELYQVAARRAMHDYELDRLFNPEYYDYQI